MSSKYAPLAEKVIELVGGPGNVVSVFNCQTRLRFTLRDETRADPKAFAGVDGVASALYAGDMFQVIIGTHVKDVYDEVAAQLGNGGDASDDEPAAGPKRKFHPINAFITFISATIIPIVPALAGAGMISALLALLTAFNLISKESQTYVVLSFMANAVFFFLPIFLAFSAAEKLKTNRIIAAAIAAMMLHPGWSALVAKGEAVHVFGIIPLTLTTYSSSVIPILLIVWVQSYVERFLERVIPNAIKIVVIPMILFLVVGLLAFSVLGPIGTLLGKGFAIGFDWLAANAPWAPALLVGATYPILIMFGVHAALAPLVFLQLGTYGYDSLVGPGAVVSNTSMAVAAAIVALRVRDAKMKQIATASSITAFMGITEPALYGVNLPKRYPLIAAMIGGAAGGLYAGITGVRRFAVGSSSVATATRTLSLVSPCRGTVVPLSAASDAAFASGALGPGTAVEPLEGRIVAPCAGTVRAAMPTGHAYGIHTDDGVEVLVHVGVDTVKMKGEGFVPAVKQGDRVEAGQTLVTADLAAIKAAGHPATVIIVVTNSEEIAAVTPRDDVDEVIAGEPIVNIRP